MPVLYASALNRYAVISAEVPQGYEVYTVSLHEANQAKHNLTHYFTLKTMDREGDNVIDFSLKLQTYLEYHDSSDSDVVKYVQNYLSGSF